MHRFISQFVWQKSKIVLIFWKQDVEKHIIYLYEHFINSKLSALELSYFIKWYHRTTTFV